jgi:hypothetical protein
MREKGNFMQADNSRSRELPFAEIFASRHIPGNYGEPRLVKVEKIGQNILVTTKTWAVASSNRTCLDYQL